MKHVPALGFQPPPLASVPLKSSVDLEITKMRQMVRRQTIMTLNVSQLEKSPAKKGLSPQPRAGG